MKNWINFIKERKVLLLIIGGVVLVVVVGVLMFSFSNRTSKADLKALTTQPSVEPYTKSLVTLKETGDVYFVSKELKRYVFASPEVFKSWFGNVAVTTEMTIKEMEKSALGGQVSVRPGTLLSTESDPNIYVALGGKDIKEITQQQIEKFYGADFAKYKVDLANYYFTAYTVNGDFSEGDITTIAAHQSPEKCLITH